MSMPHFSVRVRFGVEMETVQAQQGLHIESRKHSKICSAYHVPTLGLVVWDFLDQMMQQTK